MCKIAILENYSLFCSGIRPVLEKNDDLEVVGEAKNVINLLPLIKETRPDVIIIDVLNCGNEGFIPIKTIKKKYARIPILLIVNNDYSRHFEEYIALGVNGLVFCDSSAKKLKSAVKKLKEGEDFFPQRVWLLIKDILRTRRMDTHNQPEHRYTLTNREIAVLKLFRKGYTYKEIGNALNISPRTVESHKKNISAKIDVKSTAELVEFAMQNHIQ